MAKIPTGIEEIDGRAKAAVKKHVDVIKKRFSEAAKKKGHNIDVKKISSITYLNLGKTNLEQQSFGLGDFVIDNPTDLTYLGGCEWDNNSSEGQSYDKVIDETTTDSYNWSITAGVTTTATESAEVGITVPGFSGKIATSFSLQLSLSVTHGVAHQEQHRWTDTFHQNVAPFTRSTMRVYGKQVVGHVPFTLTTIASGKAHCEAKFRHYGSRTRGFDIDLAELLGQNGCLLTTEGKISGLQGYDYSVKTEEEELTDEERRSLPEGLHEIALLDEVSL